MPYTYNEPTGGVFGAYTSEVRFLVQDTSPAAPFSLLDSEVQYEYTQAGGNVQLTASRVAHAMALRYGREAVSQKSVGDLSLSLEYFRQRDMYEALSGQLRAGGTGSYGTPMFTGGYELTPEFEVGEHDYNG